MVLGESAVYSLVDQDTGHLSGCTLVYSQLAAERYDDMHWALSVT